MRMCSSALVPRAAGLAAACVLLAAAAVAGQAPPEGPSDTDARASFLYNLALFAEWPAVESRVRTPFTICTIGETPVASALGRYAEHVIHGRPLDVRQVRESGEAEALSGCEIAFMAERDTARLRAALARLAGQPIVTVGEAEGFLQAGGMLRIGSEEGRLRFDVELGPAERAGIKFSSRLLALAATVTRDGHPAER
jgi:hypothetical protein